MYYLIQDVMQLGMGILVLWVMGYGVSVMISRSFVNAYVRQSCRLAWGLVRLIMNAIRHIVGGIIIWVGQLVYGPRPRRRH